MTESSPEAFESDQPSESFADLFPGPEDWVALQGGKPRVFRNPTHPDSVWLVSHVYEEQTNAQQRFQNGLIVPTLPPGSEIPTSRLGITRRNFEGKTIQRDIVIPSFMLRAVHGDTCNVRSSSIGGDAYRKIRSQQEYESFIDNLRLRGFQEIRFGLAKEGFKLTPYQEIKPPKPLNPGQ